MDDWERQMFGRLSFAAAVFGAMAFSVAVAAPLGPQSELGDDGGLVTLAKKGGGGGKGGGGKGAGKGGKGGKHHHRHGGGGVFIGVSYCAIAAADCADEYGSRTRRYYRCLRNAGC
jgi:hypothetical protein